MNVKTEPAERRKIRERIIAHATVKKDPQAGLVSVGCRCKQCRALRKALEFYGYE